MDFQLDADLERIQRLARELATDFAKRPVQHDQEITSPDENCAKLKEAGFYGLVAPKQYGDQEQVCSVGSSPQKSSLKDALRLRSLSTCMLRRWRPT